METLTAPWPSQMTTHGSGMAPVRAPHLGCQALEPPELEFSSLHLSSWCPLRQMERGCVRGRQSKTVVQIPHSLARCFQWLRATGYFFICSLGLTEGSPTPLYLNVLRFLACQHNSDHVTPLLKTVEWVQIFSLKKKKMCTRAWAFPYDKPYFSATCVFRELTC